MNSPQDAEIAKHPACIPGILYPNGEVFWLAPGTSFFQIAATTVVVQQASGPYVYPNPPHFPSPNVGPTLSVPPPTVPTLPTLPVPPPTVPTLPKTKSKKCYMCSKMKPLYFMIWSNFICYECAVTKLSEGRLSSIREGAELPWSAEIIAELYLQLSKITDEAIRRRLPPTIPLPLDSFVCVARNEACEVGYPAEGHIAGTASQVVEDGCPNGHAICRGCATKLTTCPKCKSFVPYHEKPRGCLAFPCNDNHWANFEKGCEVPGCTGGPWPPKARPEEAKVVEVTVK